MADVTFDCALGFGLSDAHFWVNGDEVPLDESGLAKTGEFTTQTGVAVHLQAQLEGVDGSAWSLDITPECQGKQPQKLWTRNGTLTKGGLMLSGDAQVPADPCASKDGLELAKEILPKRLAVTAKTTKRAAKKTARRSQ